MDDLEMILACANAAEVWKDAHKRYPTVTLDATFKGVEIRGDAVYLVPNNPMRQDPQVYDPLHDDAQAMELVKKFRLMIWAETAYWLVSDADNVEGWRSLNTDLNRAIVEAVAKMHRPNSHESPRCECPRATDYETAWLVERPGPEWLAIIELGKPMWTRSIDKACRFPSKKAAANAIGRRWDGFEQAKATEHMWPALTASPESHWVSVKERLPEDELVVLVYEPRLKNIWEAYIRRGHWHFAQSHSQNLHTVTHWQYMPAAPVSGEGG